MKYLLGIDQGGSKTNVIIGDEMGNVLASETSFGAVHSVAGKEAALRAIWQASERALGFSGVSLDQIYGIYGGISGIDWKYEQDMMQYELKKLFGNQRVKVVNDCIIAMRAATNNPKSAILCAGSGLNCAVKNGASEIIYGYYIPDEIQGGSSIGNAALQKVFDAKVGIEPQTLLTDYLLRYFEVYDVDSLLMKKINGDIKWKEILYIPVLVEKAAMEGDFVSIELMKNFGRRIVPYVICGMRQLGIINESVDIVLSGSIFKCKLEAFKNTVIDGIRKEACNANIINAEYEPVIGAYFMGLDEVHTVIPDNIYEHLKQAKEHFNITRE